MTKGDKVIVRRSFALIMFDAIEDVCKPVTVLETIEVSGVLYVKFVTASGQQLCLIMNYFLMKMPEVISFWTDWMEEMIHPSLRSKDTIT